MWQVAFQFGAEQDPITSVRRYPPVTRRHEWWVAFEGEHYSERRGERGEKKE